MTLCFNELTCDGPESRCLGKVDLGWLYSTATGNLYLVVGGFGYGFSLDDFPAVTRVCGSVLKTSPPRLLPSGLDLLYFAP